MPGRIGQRLGRVERLPAQSFSFENPTHVEGSEMVRKAEFEAHYKGVTGVVPSKWYATALNGTQARNGTQGIEMVRKARVR